MKTAQQLRTQAEQARHSYKVGLIDIDQAVELIAPFVAHYNTKNTELAELYGQKPQKLTIKAFLRK